jgi:hypothetical protein
MTLGNMPAQPQVTYIRWDIYLSSLLANGCWLLRYHAPSSPAAAFFGP